MGNPPIIECFQIDEVPTVDLKLGDGTTVTTEDTLRFSSPMNGESGMDAHEHFLEGEFKTGNWELLERPRPQIPDIPLPDPSEVSLPRASRGLLDSAKRRFKR